ncbi:MAG: PD40 domain-containing protein [Acidobacteria bacterium]|nr:PD40 domain-containing protein [Acidobacteriota bacterium]
MGLISRREFLAAFPAAQARRTPGKTQQYPAELKRYADPLTEREVWRLTGTSTPHQLPHSHQRFVAHNNSFLLLGGEREGSPQALRMELPSGRMAQLSHGPGVAVSSICLAPDERSFFFLQGGALKQTGFRTLKERDIYNVEDGWLATGDLGISIDGRYAALVEMRAADRVDDATQQFERKPLCRIRVVETFKGNSWIAVEEKAWLARPQIRPKRDQILYCHEGPWERLVTRLWLVNLDGKQKQSVRPRQGEEELGPEYWSGDGKLIGYAHYPDHSGHKATVRAFNPDTREEQVLSLCTQFWHLRGNTDNSAIAGASRSKAGPNLYVLFPVIQREMTVCEHAATTVAPRAVFSPDSQWIYFASDRGGVPAVYRAAVGDLVEKT